MKTISFALSLIAILFLFTCLSCSKESGSKISSNGSHESHNPGWNCMECHIKGGAGEGNFNVAGTVYDQTGTNIYPNAVVKFYTGSNGSGTLSYAVEVDANGNFYTTENIDFGSGLYPAVEGNSATQYMQTAVTSGQCNACHGVTTDRIWTE